MPGTGSFKWRRSISVGNPFAGIGLPTSLQCSKGFHGACRRDPAECDCECHDEDLVVLEAEIAAWEAVEPALEAEKLLETVIVSGTAAEVAEMLENAVENGAVLDSPPGDPKMAEKAEKAEEIDQKADIPRSSELARGVAAAVAFLDGTREEQIIALALDQWAADVLAHDVEVKNLLAIRTKRRQTRP